MAKKKLPLEKIEFKERVATEPSVCPFCLDDPAEFDLFSEWGGQRLFRCLACGMIVAFTWAYDMWLEKYLGEG